MSKRFTLVIGAMVGLSALLAACAPGGGTEENPPEQPGLEGEAQVSVKGLSAHEIQSMVVTAHPANISKVLAYSADAGTFTGTLVLPAGTQTLTANGYAYVYPGDGGTVDGGPAMDAGSSTDGGSPADGGGTTDGGRPADGGSTTDAGSSTGLTLVATGTATVTIVANTTAAVSMRIYDLTPPRPQPDIVPIIRSVTASSINPRVNQAISLSVVAVDLDNDPLSYSWTSDCPSGSFSNPNAATTSWASSAPAACTLHVTVSSRGQTVSESVTVVVFADGSDAGTGGAQVNGEYIPRPDIYSLAVYGNSGELPYDPVYRYEPTANLPTVRPGQQYTLEFSTNFGTSLGARNMDLTVSCGTVVRHQGSCSGATNCYSAYTWTTPDAGTACRVTATATNETLTDSFSAGILVK